ncbi:alpha-hydroxy-acid oxidizing protein [Rhodococcus wratislaviensis]|uniref:Putative lactate 2-monooxygenase n=1 Tax=Rhodococcus wratislaviensis NBRC 100605 TaxID=1219028 RepID=X0QF11_RHOWR|nr:alpha-hydroxy-acid oxidizing protein [Rhodococcus wratislaviensis]GAF49451.1 putative lactate 2-monooxygenase [Rhodococcus wratislaviensis NBRC 100605]
MANYADFNIGLYFEGLGGDNPPPYPVTFAGLEAAAREKLEHRLFDYVAGGAGDEHTQRANVTAFERWGIVPRMLAGAADRDLSVELFGHRLPTPLLMSPIGVIGVMTDDEHGDLATAAASAASGVPMVASTLMQDPLEDVAVALGDTPGFFQLYTPNDREVAESLVRRAVAAGFSGIVVTLDTWTLGYRPRDLQHATFPQLRGYCLANYFSDPVFRSRLVAPPEEDPAAATMHWAMTFGNPTLTWDDLTWLRGLTDLPLLLKGICHPDDVRRARDGGVDGIYCSNHGGRQAATAPALDLLPAVVEAADGMPVIFDSGLRSGPDVVKALALGATAVGIGRPYGYGAAIGGQAGIEFVLSCLLAETDLTMGLNGYARIADLTPDALVRGLG